MAYSNLFSTGLIEKDERGDILWTWAYPSVTSEQREFFIHKSGLEKDLIHQLQFAYGRWQQSWFYIYTSTLCGEADKRLNNVTAISLVLLTKDFNPERYEALGCLFSQLYIKSGNPASILENYLSVMTRGIFVNGENGKFNLKEFETKQAYAKSNVRTVIETFGLETILIYTALMLKKRIVVYCPSLPDLLRFTRSLPALVWHRQNWEVLYPYLEIQEEEIKTIKSSSHYIAGFTEAAVESRSDLYDIFVNVPTSQIVVPPSAKECLAMGKLHKDVAMLMVQSTENKENTDQDIIMKLANKTKELLNNLKTLCTDDGNNKLYITLEALRERKLPIATENFLFNLAACEGLVKL